MPVEYKQLSRKTPTNKPDYADVITVARILYSAETPQDASAYKRLQLDNVCSFEKNPQLAEELRIIQSAYH